MTQRFSLAVLVALVSLAAAGCGQPRIAPHNLELTVKLRTAISAQNEEWLTQTEALVNERHAAGEMSAEEQEAFQAIIAQARNGQWRDAELACLDLQRAQRPESDRQAHMARMQELSRPQ
jgi:hypothetical protein